MMNLGSLAWPKSQLPEAMTALATASRLPIVARDNAADSAVERVAARLGLEAEAVDANYSDVETALSGAGPAFIEVGGDQMIALVRGGRDRLGGGESRRGAHGGRLVF